MKTLAQTRDEIIRKLSKKRKLGKYSHLKRSGSKSLPQKKVSGENRKCESTLKRLPCKKDNKRTGHPSDCSDKQDSKERQVVLALSSTEKTKSSGLQTKSLKRRRKHNGKKDTVCVDEALRLQRRARYLLVRLNLEQNLIEAYLGEGWKGQSREKIKPEKELLRARNQILKCKLGIRDVVRQLDSLSAIGQIDSSFIAADGSVHHEHIFCKKCVSQEVSEDNDIILCDGTCNCAFHQKCIDPPLATEDIPPEDVGWLCKYCDCKIEILDALNAHLGTQFLADNKWQDIFREEARLSEVGTREYNSEEEWPSDESDDNDYDPRSGDSMEESSSDGDSSSGSSCCSLESETCSEPALAAGDIGKLSNVSKTLLSSMMDANNHELVNGPRQRSTVDYKKLYDEMFGKDAVTSELFSEDEDWGPSKKRRKESESDAASTLTALCEDEMESSELLKLPVGRNNVPNSKARKPLSRIQRDTLQKLRQAFADNELPSREDKEKISESLGLEYVKVNKWFKNARYMALKKRKLLDGVSLSSTPEKPGLELDKAADTSNVKFSSSRSSAHKKKRFKRVSWNTNLITWLGPLKKQKVKTSVGQVKEKEDLSDDLCLKKHLMHLKAKTKEKGKVKLLNDPIEAQSPEMQMEHLCRMSAKLQKLKQNLSTLQKALRNESNDLCLHGHVVYVPVAEIKEKL